MKSLSYSIIVLLTLFCFDAGAQYRGFRIPKSSEFTLSPTFMVEIKQGDSIYKEVPVAKYNVPESQKTKTENFAMFAFEPKSGEISIRISLVNGTALTENSIEVVNKLMPQLSSRFENGKLIVSTASNMCQILVRFKADYSNQLLIMANPYTERAIPKSAIVKRFEYATSPNIQTAQYDRYSVPNDVDVVYIEEGAVVKGTIHTSSGRTKPLILMGRGVVIGNGNIVSGSSGMPYNAIELPDGNGHILDGILSISPRHFTIRVSNNAVISNVKMFGYNANVDGIVAGTGSVIENCYSKVNDDHIKLYNSNITVRNCCFYEQTNGGVFQLAWNSVKPGSNCLVENCEILAWEASCGDPKLGQGGFARSFINLRNTDSYPTSTNCVFRNIRIQGQAPRFICINGKYSGSNSLSLTNFTIENVVVDQKPTTYSWIYTGDSPYEISFNFKNVTIAGECLTAGNYQFNTEGNVKLNYQGCGPADVEAPSVPSNLKLDNATINALAISWSAATDNIAVTNYEVFVNGQLKATVKEPSANLTDMQSGTSFSIKVRAKDGAGNLSNFSPEVAFSTLTCTDSEAPSIPQNIVVANEKPTAADVSWNASTDNVGVTQYEIFVDGVLKTTATTNSATLSGLLCNKSYTIKIRAADLCRNLSAFSAESTLKTAECPACVVSVEGGNGIQPTQTPYKTHTIPGIIEAEDFDNGGEGVAFKESDGRATWAHLTYRTTELIDIDEADGSDANTGTVIGGIAAGEWAEYSVTVPEAGNYYLHVRYSCNGDKKAYFKVNDKLVGCSETFTSTANTKTYITKTIELPFKFESGNNLFSWVSETSLAFNFDRFKFTKDFVDGISSTTSDSKVINNCIVDANRILSLDLSKANGSTHISIFDISGKKVFSTSTLSTNDSYAVQLTKELNSGIYFVTMLNNGIKRVDKIILK